MTLRGVYDIYYLPTHVSFCATVEDPMKWLISRFSPVRKNLNESFRSSRSNNFVTFPKKYNLDLRNCRIPWDTSKSLRRTDIHLLPMRNLTLGDFLIFILIRSTETPNWLVVYSCNQGSMHTVDS